jgi:hypothetical protein
VVAALLAAVLISTRDSRAMAESGEPPAAIPA